MILFICTLAVDCLMYPMPPRAPQEPGTILLPPMCPEAVEWQATMDQGIKKLLKLADFLQRHYTVIG